MELDCSIVSECEHGKELEALLSCVQLEHAQAWLTVDATKREPVESDATALELADAGYVCKHEMMAEVAGRDSRRQRRQQQCRKKSLVLLT